MKILDTLLEVKDLIKVSDADIIKATKSKITELNNPNFAKLVKAWGRGTYDDKVETFYFQLAELLDKEKIK